MLYLARQRYKKAELSPIMKDDRHEIVKKYWVKIENIFRCYFNNEVRVPYGVVRSNCQDIYFYNLVPLFYSKLIGYAKNELKEAKLEGLALEETVEYFRTLRSNMRCFYKDAYPLMVEGNRIIRKKSFKPSPDTFKHSIYRLLRKKLKSVSEVLSREVVRIIVKDRECKKSPRVVRQAFRLFIHYRLFSLVLDRLSQKLVEVYTKECEEPDIDKRVCKIYMLVDKEGKNRYLKGIFRTLEKIFLQSVLCSDLELFFRISREETFRYLTDMYIRGHGVDSFYQKIEAFSARYKISGFMDYHMLLEKLEVFKKGTEDVFLIEKIDLLIRKATAENENKIIIDGIETVSSSYCPVENDAGKKGPSKKDLQAYVAKRQKLSLSLAKILKFTTKREEFDAHFRVRCADFLLRNEVCFASDFLKCAKAENLMPNCIYRIEVMLEESETRLMTSASEILYIRSCYWPRYENTNAKISELESIKRRFIREEKRKNPRVEVNFVDSISLCEIDFCGAPLVVTVFQYKMLSLLARGRKRKKDLEDIINLTSFDEHYNPLVECRLVAEKDGVLEIQPGDVDRGCLPTSFSKKIEKSKHKTKDKDAEDEKSGNILDCNIMKIMKRERRAKEAVLCRRLRSRLDLFTARVNMLVEKAYLKRENNDIIYMP